MHRLDDFSGLTEFLAVARNSSFRAAANELAVTPGSISQAIRALERRLGVPLFHRTTRRVALTEAGETLRQRLGPAARSIVEVLGDVRELRSEPSGTLRLIVHRVAVQHVIAPVLDDFCKAYPQVKLEIVIDDIHHELVQGGYDAGIRVGEFIERDLIAVRISRPFEWVVLGAPSYIKTWGQPQSPEDLAAHQCVRYQLPGTQSAYRWEFVREGHALSVEVPGSVLVTDADLLRSLAVQGMGLIYTSTLQAAAELSAGLLTPVLQEFAPAGDAIYICYPKSSGSQRKLRAFIDMARTKVDLNPGIASKAPSGPAG